MTSLKYYIEQVEQFISALTDDIESGEGTIVTQTKLAVYQEVLEHLEEIEQEPKTGHWIVHEKPHGIRYLECPHCNIWYLNEHLIRNSYCPNCGARMIEPQE